MVPFVAALSSLAEPVQNYAMQTNLNAQQNSYYRENMRYENQLNRRNAFDSVANSTGALRAAGLSPAMANGSMSLATHPASASLGSSSLPPSKSSFLDYLKAPAEIEGIQSAIDLNRSQSELNESTAAKNYAEVDVLQQQRNEKDAETNMISATMRPALQDIAKESDSPFVRSFVEEALKPTSALMEQDGKPVYNLGSLRAFSEVFFNMSQREREKALDEIAKRMDIKVLEMRLNNDRDAEALARQPSDLRFELYKRAALMDAQIVNLGKQNELTDEQKSMLVEQANSLKVGAERLYHQDPSAMWQNGDYASLLVGLGYDASAKFAEGIGIGTGIAVGSKVGAAVPSVPSVGKSSKVPRVSEVTGDYISRKAASSGMTKELSYDIWSRINKNYPNASPAEKKRMFDEMVKRFKDFKE